MYVYEYVFPVAVFLALEKENPNETNNVLPFSTRRVALRCLVEKKEEEKLGKMLGSGKKITSRFYAYL